MNDFRRPELGQAYDAYEIPLRYDGIMQLEDQWTMTVCLDEDNGFFIGATVYNGNAQRGAYFMTGMKSWSLTEFELVGNEAHIPAEVMRRASSQLASILGPDISVSHHCLPMFSAKPWKARVPSALR